MAQANPKLNVTYHKGQSALFFHCKERFRVITKGRRWGFTRGAAQYIIESMLDGQGPCMWGDTVVVNIERYIERYFIPVLKQLPSDMWEWRKQAKQLHINGQVCDFRSADNPENWEGFGYRIIVLNEAGIILKNQYLWHNAVRPMLMDYHDSIAIIGGTPKGKGLFYELWKKGEDADPNWKSFKFSTYSNPFMTQQAVDELVADLPEGVLRQELYAEFAEVGDKTLLPYDLILQCMKRIPDAKKSTIEVWGLDVARHGDDSSVLAMRNGMRIYHLAGVSIPDTMQLTSWLNYQFVHAVMKPIKIFIETTGIGWGVFDRAKEMGLPVHAADVATKAARTNCLNKRAEIYINLMEAMKRDLVLPDDRRLLRQLSNIQYELKGNDIKLVDKEKIKAELGESPDYADAAALTFFEPVTQAHRIHRAVDERPDKTEWSPFSYA